VWYLVKHRDNFNCTFITLILIMFKKVKGKVVPVLLAEHNVMKTYWGSEGIDPRIQHRQ